ncbi:MAG: aminotransferase class III-fold pyridoxal phosphate-dependent enzyme [Clostridia bacterium]
MEQKNCAISKLEPAKDINARLKKLTDDRQVYSVGDNDLKNVLNYYETKCSKSKAITSEAKEYIPGGVQHNLAFNYPFPLCFNKADGAYLYDIDGNKYFDFLQAGGPTILGSNYSATKEKVIDLINNCGPVTGLFHEAELLIAKEIRKHMPACEMFRMLGSGTESVMAAIRVARCATGNKRVVKMGGGYHGWSDQMVYGLKIPGSRNFMESHGIPGTCFKQTDEVRPNDLVMLEKMLKRNKHKGGTACVIVEPVGPESGTRPVDFNYNQQALELAHKYGALFIFDEVVTGFRVGLSGAQGYFNVKPDLTIFGKIIAGGYPGAGGVGGKSEYIRCMSAGVASGMKRAYVGGTLAANPLSAYAGYVTIKEIERTNACAIAGKAGDRLAAGLQKLVDKYKLPYVAYNQGSIVHLECTGAMSYDFSNFNILKSLLPLLKKKPEMLQRKVEMEHMGAAYMANGIVTLAGSRMYTSMADTDEIIDAALVQFDKVFSMVKPRPIKSNEEWKAEQQAKSAK